MDLFIIILLAVALVAIAFVGLALQILVKKGGKFPNTHVGGNSYLIRQGITCAKTQDKIEQAEINRNIDFKKIRFTGIVK